MGRKMFMMGGLGVFGISSDSGAEVLIHIGMDTVQSDGKYFYPKVKQGEHVEAGQLLLKFDIKSIQAEGYSLTSPVVITNSGNYLDVIETDKKSVDYKDELLTVII